MHHTQINKTERVIANEVYLTEETFVEDLLEEENKQKKRKKEKHTRDFSTIQSNKQAR